MNIKRALIIANGEPCSPFLLEKSQQTCSLTIVLDGAVHQIMQKKIAFDILFGDFDRDEIDFQKIKSYAPNAMIISAEDQDETDFVKAINYLIEQHFDEVIILWATGRRADHAISNMTNIARFRDKIAIRMCDDYSEISLLPILPKVFRKEYKAKTNISLIPIGTVEGITTKNLTYPLHHETLKMGYRTGNSNEVHEDGMVEISYETGDLLLMECHDKID